MRSRSPSRKDWLHGGSWIPIRKELQESPAWRLRPKPLIKILSRLEIEHMRHAGKENGALFVTYEQFVAFGVSKKFVRRMLALGAAIGLLEVIQTDKWIGDIRPPNAYRLCYLPAKGQGAPTDEWFFVDVDRVLAILAAASQKADAAGDEPLENAG